MHAPQYHSLFSGCQCLLGHSQSKQARLRVQDPHFKVQNHRRRIVTPQLLAEYAFLLAHGGRLYTATDVPEARIRWSTCLCCFLAFSFATDVRQRHFLASTLTHHRCKRTVRFLT